VYERLTALPQFFEITGVVNLDPGKAVRNGIDPKHIRRDAKRLIEGDCDIVVELIGGVDTADEYVRHALRSGRHVVSANKALIAERGDELHRIASLNEVSFRYSAAVGGSLPALEAVTRIAERGEIVGVAGIINGTCNFICDSLADGIDFDTAVGLAQSKGYAEADPTLDLDGSDAAQKLILLARAAFDSSLRFEDIDRTGIQDLSPSASGEIHRLIAECKRTTFGLEVRVAPAIVTAGHPFAETTGSSNCLIIETSDGETEILRGRGAGRYATTESVIADLFDIREQLQRASSRVAASTPFVLEAAA
jgi:homoserine dehydrogenase